MTPCNWNQLGINDRERPYSVDARRTVIEAEEREAKEFGQRIAQQAVEKHGHILTEALRKLSSEKR